MAGTARYGGDVNYFAAMTKGGESVAALPSTTPATPELNSPASPAGSAFASRAPAGKHVHMGDTMELAFEDVTDRSGGDNTRGRQMLRRGQDSSTTASHGAGHSRARSSPFAVSSPPGSPSPLRSSPSPSPLTQEHEQQLVRFQQQQQSGKSPRTATASAGPQGRRHIRFMTEGSNKVWDCPSLSPSPSPLPRQQQQLQFQLQLQQAYGSNNSAGNESPMPWERAAAGAAEYYPEAYNNTDNEEGYDDSSEPNSPPQNLMEAREQLRVMAITKAETEERCRQQRQEEFERLSRRRLAAALTTADLYSQTQLEAALLASGADTDDYYVDTRRGETAPATVEAPPITQVPSPSRSHVMMFAAAEEFGRIQRGGVDAEEVARAAAQRRAEELELRALEEKAKKLAAAAEAEAALRRSRHGPHQQPTLVQRHRLTKTWGGNDSVNNGNGFGGYSNSRYGETATVELRQETMGGRWALGSGATKEVTLSAFADYAAQAAAHEAALKVTAEVDEDIELTRAEQAFTAFTAFNQVHDDVQDALTEAGSRSREAHLATYAKKKRGEYRKSVDLAENLFRSAAGGAAAEAAQARGRAAARSRARSDGMYLAIEAQNRRAQFSRQICGKPENEDVDDEEEEELRQNIYRLTNGDGSGDVDSAYSPGEGSQQSLTPTPTHQSRRPLLLLRNGSSEDGRESVTPTNGRRELSMTPSSVTSRRIGGLDSRETSMTPTAGRERERGGHGSMTPTPTGHRRDGDEASYGYGEGAMVVTPTAIGGSVAGRTVTSRGGTIAALNGESLATAADAAEIAFVFEPRLPVWSRAADRQVLEKQHGEILASWDGAIAQLQAKMPAERATKLKDEEGRRGGYKISRDLTSYERWHDKQEEEEERLRQEMLEELERARRGEAKLPRQKEMERMLALENGEAEDEDPYYGDEAARRAAAERDNAAAVAAASAVEAELWLDTIQQLKVGKKSGEISRYEGYVLQRQAEEDKLRRKMDEELSRVRRGEPPADRRPIDAEAEAEAHQEEKEAAEAAAIAAEAAAAATRHAADAEAAAAQAAVDGGAAAAAAAAAEAAAAADARQLQRMAAMSAARKEADQGRRDVEKRHRAELQQQQQQQRQRTVSRSVSPSPADFGSASASSPKAAAAATAAAVQMPVRKELAEFLQRKSSNAAAASPAASLASAAAADQQPSSS